VTGLEFYEVTAVMFGNLPPSYKLHFGAQINRANEKKMQAEVLSCEQSTVIGNGKSG
jgi:hypothetical protein